MDLKICENLKELRRQKGNTQEELAEHLNISMQAVSKWERNESYPDITLVPALALYYNVTSDRLLGIDEDRIDKKIEDYTKKDREIYIQEANRPEQAAKRTALWREAQREFPNNHTVLLNLIYALDYPHWEPNENLEEIVQIGERLLAESTNTALRSEVIYTLCNACAVKKDFENAKRYANMAPSIWSSHEILYGRCLLGEERLEQRQRCIAMFIREIYKTFIQDLYGTRYVCSSISGDEAVKVCEFALGLYRLLYPDDDFGEDETWIAAICNVLANQYSGIDNDKALFYLDETANHYVRFYTQGEFRHTSFMVNRLTCPGYSGSKDLMRKLVSQDIKVIEETEDLDFIRNDERYTAAIEKLKNLLK